MEIDKEKVAEQASQLKDQAVEMMSKVDVKKATGVADAFMNKVFFFGKMFSALVMFGCVVAIIGSLVYYIFATSDSLQVPVFDAAIASQQAAQGEDVSTPDLSNLLEKNAVRKKYQSKIEALIRAGNFDSSFFEDMVKFLVKLDKPYRSAFINGAVKYVENTKKWSIEKAKKFDAEECLEKYGWLFETAMNKAEAGKADAQARKGAALGICGGACLGLILFLMIPLLIKIEENTRK